MFGFLRRAASAEPAPQVPAGIAVYAIGDIHGRLDLLSDLLGKIEEDAKSCREARRILVFVGDYVDRGPDSRGVVERVLAGVPTFETVCLKGNHEQVLLDFLADPLVWDHWRRFGGLETLASYQVDRHLLFGANVAPAAIRDAFAEALPQRHKDFLASLPRSYECGDYYFVHAGVRPGIPLERQVEADQLWIREDFLDSGKTTGGRVVVHGHTPRPAPEKLDFRIGIDTGAYLTGRLTAVKLIGPQVTFLQS